VRQGPPGLNPALLPVNTSCQPNTYWALPWHIVHGFVWSKLLAVRSTGNPKPCSSWFSFGVVKAGFPTGWMPAERRTGTTFSCLHEVPPPHEYQWNACQQSSRKTDQLATVHSAATHFRPRWTIFKYNCN